MMLLEMISQNADLSLAPQGYRLGEIVGTGGMGVVYALHSLVSEKNSDLVVKMVHPLISNYYEAELQLKYEAEIEQALQGLPYVVETLSYGQHQKGHGYKIMRLMTGISLKAWMRKNPAKFESLEIPETHQFRKIFLAFAKSFETADLKLRLMLILPIFRKLVEAVAAIHERGVVHGDLKPSNIMLSDDLSHLRLFDFGLAQYHSLAVRAKPSFAAYTPLYASPAVLKGKAPEMMDDAYSLAMIFWEMLFGKENLRARKVPIELKHSQALQYFFKKLHAADHDGRKVSMQSLRRLLLRLQGAL